MTKRTSGGGDNFCNMTGIYILYELHILLGYDVSLLIDLEKLPSSDKEKGKHAAIMHFTK
jgi:hypothetical protein